jgi:hypothetical protein
MKEEIKITITFADDNIALYGENIQDLTEDDIIDSVKMLSSLAKTQSILQEGDPTNGNAQIRH